MLLEWFSSAFFVATHSHLGSLFTYDHISYWISESQVNNELWTSQPHTTLLQEGHRSVCLDHVWGSTVLASGDSLKLVTEYSMAQDGIQKFHRVSELPLTSGHLPAAAVRSAPSRGFGCFIWVLVRQWLLKWRHDSSNDSKHSNKWQECRLRRKRLGYLAWSEQRCSSLFYHNSEEDKLMAFTALTWRFSCDLFMLFTLNVSLKKTSEPERKDSISVP